MGEEKSYHSTRQDIYVHLVLRAVPLFRERISSKKIIEINMSMTKYINEM